MSLLWKLFGGFEHDLAALRPGAYRFWVLASRIGCVLALVAITVFSLIPRAPDGSLLDLESHGLDDKVSHILAYAALMGSASWSLETVRARMLAFLGFVFYGFLMEMGQSFVSVTREGSLADWAADIVGLMIGVWLAIWFARWLIRFGGGRPEGS